MKKLVLRKLRFLCIAVVLFVGCEINPLTGERYFSLYTDAQIFQMADEEYAAFLKKNPPIPTSDPTNGANAAMVKRVGKNIKDAAQKWLESEGEPHYLDNYDWQYELVKDNQVNAWCMPGGKIVVYTGILRVTEDEDTLAIVMGHEVCHAILNHGKQRMSAGILQQLGATVLGMFTDSQLIMAAYGLTTNVGVMLKFSRENETEADEYGLILAAIAGYDPDKAPAFWERMNKESGGSNSKLVTLLSTHPNSKARADALKGLIPKAKAKAEELNGTTGGNSGNG